MDKLPDEMIIEIIFQLSEIESYQSFCLVGKKYHQIATDKKVIDYIDQKFPQLMRIKTLIISFKYYILRNGVYHGKYCMYNDKEILLYEKHFNDGLLQGPMKMLIDKGKLIVFNYNNEPSYVIESLNRFITCSAIEPHPDHQDKVVRCHQQVKQMKGNSYCEKHLKAKYSILPYCKKDKIWEIPVNLWGDQWISISRK